MSTGRTDVEHAVRQRYSAAAEERVEALCCPVEYDRRFLDAIPQEIIARDYGCGDPSRHLNAGEVVLDLGSGGGKICYIAAQVVGPQGRVIGIDMNDEMLGLAESHRQSIAQRIGYDNVSFCKGRIQDLALDVAALESRLSERPVASPLDLERLERWIAKQRRDHPLVATGSVDVVVSNCVLNLVAAEDKPRLFGEIHRVLRGGGRAVISDIACDEEVPEELQADPELWTGCVSGALREDRLLEAFEQAGFHGVRLLARDEQPWRVVRGIEFRSLTVEAFKGEDAPCLERRQAVIYRGPWRTVIDDDGRTLRRGDRTAVCDRTFRRYQLEPYADQLDAVPPYAEVGDAEAMPFERDRNTTRRDPRETKGARYAADGAPAVDRSRKSCC